MLLTITTTHRPATDLGYLLHKRPDRVQAFDLGFGAAHVFYPEATEERCTAALLLDVDPVALVRGRGGAGGLLRQYLNDRPYAASSLLSVAIAQVYGSALGGRSKERPELAGRPLPLTATVAALPCRGGDTAVRRLFEPLGYDLILEDPEADRADDDWERGPYRNLTLTGRTTLTALLTHLYVLIPVLDDDKHYWVGDDEVQKLLRRGEGWLPDHPERQFITRRYLRHQRRLERQALLQLAEAEGEAAADEGAPGTEESMEIEGSMEIEESMERPIRLHDLRIEAVAGLLADSGARRVLDLGCGEGQLVRRLMRDDRFSEIVGIDISTRSLEIAARRARLAELSPERRARIRLLQGSLTYRDSRLHGYDAAAVVEVIEHFEPARLPMFELVLFAHARPATIVVTTPNREYNANFPNLASGALRHPDHRFEWTRAEFAAWAERVADTHGYQVTFAPIGATDPERGPPTQMGVFRRCR